MNCTRSGFPVARLLAVASAVLLLTPSIASAQVAPMTDRLLGDVGGATFITQSVIRSLDTKSSVLPYAFVDYGRFFARVDTLGMKTLGLGYGHLELAARVSQDGWRANSAALSGLTDRKTSIPLGIGTFQKTPYGAFFLNAFVDANKSRGTLLDATYAAEFKLGRVSLYPQVGVEYRNAKYTNYFYGVSSGESAASGYAAYNAGASTTPMLGLAGDVPLAETWVLSMQLRQKWLDSAVFSSPLVNNKTQGSGFIALSYRFK